MIEIYTTMCANDKWYMDECINFKGGYGVFFGQILFFWREARIFFFLHQNQNIFQQQWESDYLKKKTYPTPLKLIGRSLKIKNHKGIKTVLNYLTKTSFGVVLRRRDFVCLTKKYCIKIAINIS
jgi:hypothetical protein